MPPVGSWPARNSNGDERVKTTRRFFLKSSGIALAGVGSGFFNLPGFLTRAAETTRQQGKTLVVRGPAPALAEQVEASGFARHQGCAEGCLWVEGGA